MATAAPASDAKADSARPFFMPSGVNFDELPEELKAAILAIVNPAYRQLVLEAQDGLERSGGITVVHLLYRAQAGSISKAPLRRQEATARVETDFRAVVQYLHSERTMARLNKWTLAVATRTALPRWSVLAASLNFNPRTCCAMPTLGTVRWPGVSPGWGRVS